MSTQLNFRLYVLGSSALTALVILNAYFAKLQFYPTCLYLVTSKTSMMVLGNMAFLTFLLFANLLKKLFFGPLRDVEVEHLTEKIWSTMMDTLLIMTVFREEFNSRFITLFVFLLFMKTFHWLSQDRVDFIQQTPQVSRATHTRISSLLSLLIILDAVFVYHSAYVILFQIKGPSMMILFGFEYLLLTSAAISTLIKYFFNIIDMRRDGRWENKGAYVLYLEFGVECFRLAVYMAFFGIILTYYGIPLHIIRSLYITFISFRRKLAEVVRYRKATANMDARFPNATPEELRNAETCIVCREEMREAKKLPCGHILHLHCLRSWLERQQVCPICRTPVLQEEIPGFQQAAQQAQQAQPLEQILLLQQQVNTINQQLQILYEHLANQQRMQGNRNGNANNTNVNPRPNPQNNSNQNLDDLSEEELLRLAIEESEKMALTAKSPVKSPANSPAPQRGGKDEERKDEDRKDEDREDEKEGKEDRETLRKRRLLRFSQQ